MNWTAHLHPRHTRGEGMPCHVRLGRCIAVLVLLSVTSADGAVGPRVTFTPKAFDFGCKPYGLKLPGSFVLTNEGDEPLVISKIESSCGCVAAYTGDIVIKPGERFLFKFSLETASYKDGTIKLHTNQRDQPTVLLPVHMKPLREVQLTEKDIAFGTVSHGQDRTEKFMLWIADPKKPVRILSLTSTIAHLSLSHQERVVSNRQGHEISATLSTQGMPLGRFGGWIHIALDLPQQPVIQIEVGGKVVAGIVLSPNPLSIRVLARALQAGVQRPVTVRATSGHKFRIRDVKSNDPYVHAEVRSQEPAARHLLTVSLAENTPPTQGTKKATIQVVTDSEHEPVLSLRVYYSVRKSRGSR